jgi:hypothetical protein
MLECDDDQHRPPRLACDGSPRGLHPARIETVEDELPALPLDIELPDRVDAAARVV